MWKIRPTAPTLLTMLESLHIKSFRGLADVPFDGLRPINILVGENNSGKTSVLEAIMLAMAPGSSKNWFQILQARDAAWNPQSFGEMAKWLFPVIGRDHIDERKPIELQWAMNGGGESLRLVFGQSVEVVPVPKKRDGVAVIEEEPLTTTTLATEWSSQETGTKSGEIIFAQAPSSSRYTQPIKLDASLERIPARRCILVKPQAHRFGRFPGESLSSAIKAGEKEAVVNFLQMFDPDLAEIDIVGERFGTSIYVQHRKLGPMPIHAFGDGMRKAVLVAGMAFEAEGGLLLLDEAEVALHVSSQDQFFRALFELCQRLKVQVVLTTHSLEAVDAVLKACAGADDRLTAFRLEKPDGSLRLTRYPGPLLRETRYDMGFEIR